MRQPKATSYFTVRPETTKNKTFIAQDVAFYSEDGTPLNEAIANLDEALAEKAPMDHVHDGEDGLPGVDGKDGEDGLPGVDGKDGEDGLPGVDGKDGKDGLPGKDGSDGRDGVDLDPEHSHDNYVTDDELEALVERVGHLETTVADHRFITSADSHTNGLIQPLSPDGDALWENVNTLRISNVDADGRPVSMEQVYPTIAIRLVDHDNSGHLVGAVESVSDEGDYTTLNVTASHGVGAPRPGHDVVMSVFPPGGESDLSLYVTQDQLASGLSGKAASSHSHGYASSGHSHSSYAIKGASKKVMLDDGSTGPVQFTVSGNNLYWSK